MTSSSFRLVARAAFATVLLAVAGFTWEFARFGFDAPGAVERLETGTRDDFARRAREIDLLARDIAGEASVIQTASAPSSDKLPILFADLATRARAASRSPVSATVYVVPGPPGAYRVLAWSEGPSGTPPPDRLSGPAAVFVEHGTSGLHLVALRPIEIDGRRLGVAAAETVIATEATGATTAAYALETPFGPIGVDQHFAGGTAAPGTFVLSNDAGAPLIDVHFSEQDLARERHDVRARVFVVAALPLVLVIVVLAGHAVDRRRATRGWAMAGWSAVAAALVALVALALVGLSRAVHLPPVVEDAIVSLALVGLVAIGPISWWWRRAVRRQPGRARGAFTVEHAIAGVLVAGLLVGLSHALAARIDASHLAEWQFPLFPLEVVGLLYLAALLLTEIAIYWTVIAVLGLVAARWRVDWRRPGRALAAATLWIAPTIAVVLVRRDPLPLPVAGLLTAALVAAIFGLAALSFRRYYRRASETTRLVLLFAALYAPSLVLYPMAWFYEDRTARAMVTDEYAPAAVGHAAELARELQHVQADIDAMSPELLAGLVAGARSPGAAVSSYAAFKVWSGTSLARTRLTSSIELYGPDRSLVSRFALNIPEYLSRVIARAWEGDGCGWTAYAEVDRFGGTDRPMLHAERGLCDRAGRVLGAVVVHVARDFGALPFVAPSNPYVQVLGAGPDSPLGSRLASLQLAVYGWDFRPVFGRLAWSITDDIARALYRTRAGFWRTLTVGATTYDVYFSSDRHDIYALGVPVATPFEHLTRLAAAAALTAGLFVLLLVGATVYAPFAPERSAPLGALFQDIRTSFYRKLFLFFVLAALGPVLVLALAFSEYMTQKMRADVETEAQSVVTVAQSVLEEVVALQTSRAAPDAPVSDDVMVWAGRVLDEDVNLFDGADLVATSQRDLFDSGLLPKRTPAAVYRAIALEHRPTAVVEDHLGTFAYLVAASPVRSRGPGAVLSVPLPLRQRDIELETDEFDRGVLVGAAFVILLAALLGASVAGRISDPIARVTRAATQIAAGNLDVRVVADTADELRQLVDDFNRMAATLGAQRAELARTHQFKAWAEMARQVAHEIKNPLTPVQLAAEHLQRVHEDRGRPLGPVFDQCVTTILRQVRLLRRIAGEFANFAGNPTPELTSVAPADLVDEVVAPYRAGLPDGVRIDLDVPASLPPARVDRTLIARALTNVVENALQAMPQGGVLTVSGAETPTAIVITARDTGVGMEPAAVRRAFEPYFSTKTAGSGLGLANARRNVERCGGSMTLDSTPGEGTLITMRLPRAADPSGS